MERPARSPTAVLGSQIADTATAAKCPLPDLVHCATALRAAWPTGIGRTQKPWLCGDFKLQVAEAQIVPRIDAQKR